MKIIRLVRRLFLGVLITFWGILIVALIERLVTGGPAAVEKYLWEFMYNHGDLGPVPNKLEWGPLLFVLASYSLITFVLLFFELRTRRRLSGGYDPGPYHADDVPGPSQEETGDNDRMGSASQ